MSPSGIAWSALFGSGVCRGNTPDLVNRDPKLLLPVQECSSCVRAGVVLELVCQLAEVAGDLLDASDRVLRRHGAQRNPACQCSPALDRGAGESLA